MPELAEVDYFRKQWNPGLRHRIDQVLLHPRTRIFRGTNTAQVVRGLTGATLERSEARGKQMLFVARGKGRGTKSRLWLGLHLGMTGELRVEQVDFKPAKHDHLVLHQAGRSLVFQDARQFGRVLLAEGPEAPGWWSKLPPDLLSAAFTVKELADFLRRRARAPIKAVLLMPTKFFGVPPSIPGNRRVRSMRKSSKNSIAKSVTSAGRRCASSVKTGPIRPIRGSSIIDGIKAALVREPARSCSMQPSAGERRAGRRRDRS